MREILLRKLVSLGRDEDGAALVTTLAMFFFMFVTLAALYAFGTVIREKIQLQNACDAAAYSAAVVQADTFSRVAAMNRTMAWTYVQMTRRQLDYVVMKMLDRACAHFERDQKTAREYAKKGFILKPCAQHRSQGGGWDILANSSPETRDRIQVNGLNISFVPNLPMVGHFLNLGAAEYESELKTYIDTSGALNTIKLISSGDAIAIAGQPWSVALEATSLAPGFIWAPRGLQDTLTYKSDLETLGSVTRMMGDCVNDSSSLGGEVTLFLNQLKTQILLDRLTIATLNLAERRLVREMPQRIEDAVRDTLRANLPSKGREDFYYRVEHDRFPLESETVPTSGAEDLILPGYFRNLHNNHNDERMFLEWAGYDRKNKVAETLNQSSIDALLGHTAGGIDQWFVRGNGKRRTDGEPGLQRGFKHWAEKFSQTKYNPYVPSCWNEEKLHESPKTVAPYCEWQWWADKWMCYDGLFIHFHIPVMTWGLVNRKCDFNDGPGKNWLAVIMAKIDWITSLPSALSCCIDGLKGLRSCQNTSEDDVTTSESGGEKDCPMEKYQDGCLIALEFPFAEIRFPLPFTQYARVYADDPNLYNEAYVGECAKPLVLRQSYFSKNGTISVCLASRVKNPWARILRGEALQGLYSIFNRDIGWNWAFASAKAGFRDPDRQTSSDGSDRTYRISWDETNGDRGSEGDKYWNLIQDDWDAVLLPVRQARSLALGSGSAGIWLPLGGEGFIEDWIKGKWTNLDSGSEESDLASEWESVVAPPGMAGDSGSLKWRELADAMYH